MTRNREDKDVSPAVRREVIDRDGQSCRVCGQWVEYPALHHVLYRSQGGQHVASNLVVVGWLPGHDCHLRFAHGPDAMLFRQLLTLAIEHPGTTALALRRWMHNSPVPVRHGAVT